MESVNTAVLSHGNFSSILMAAKHNLNFVHCLYRILLYLVAPFDFFWEGCRELCLYWAIPRETTLHHSLDLQAVPELVAWKPIALLPLLIAYLTICECKSKRPAFSVTRRMELGIQSTSLASDVAGKELFFEQTGGNSVRLEMSGSNHYLPIVACCFWKFKEDVIE